MGLLSGLRGYMHYGIKGVYDRRISVSQYKHYDDILSHIDAIDEMEEDKEKAEREIKALEAEVAGDTEWEFFKTWWHSSRLEYEQQSLGLRSYYQHYRYHEGVITPILKLIGYNVWMYVLCLIPSALFSGIHYLVNGKVTWLQFFWGAAGIYLLWAIILVIKATKTWKDTNRT